MNEDLLTGELTYKAVRSGGPGGQHANKVASKVVLTFDLAGSQAFSDKEKERIRLKLAKRLSGDQKLQMYSDSARSQHKNKELVTSRFLSLVNEALKVRKKRRKTRPSKSAIEKCLRIKKKAAEKKSNRRKPSHDI